MSALNWIPAERQADYHHRAADIMQMAYAREGQRAFESTKHCAAIHEAGHCVVNRLTASPDRKGMWWPPARTRIWRAPIKGMVCWLGETLPDKKAPPFYADARTDLAGYLVLAIRTVGGIAAELAFDGADYRAGSSIDEWLVAGGCAQALATVGAFPTAEKALDVLLMCATQMLRRNESSVLAIASQLERNLKIEGPALAALLMEVRGGCG